MLKMFDTIYTVEQNKTYKIVQKWLWNNNIDDDIEMQMLQRITQECDNAIDNEKYECKIIQFPR
jgi:hypothetical protein